MPRTRHFYSTDPSDVKEQEPSAAKEQTTDGEGSGDQILIYVNIYSFPSEHLSSTAHRARAFLTEVGQGTGKGLVGKAQGNERVGFFGAKRCM